MLLFAGDLRLHALDQVVAAAELVDDEGDRVLQEEERLAGARAGRASDVDGVGPEGGLEHSLLDRLHALTKGAAAIAEA